MNRPPYAAYLLLLYLPIWIWAAVHPLTRIGWFLENILIFIFIPFIIWTYFKFRLSNISYTLLFLFLVLHTIGGHYTYEQVPVGYWVKELFGFSRNHYDRFVHFCFGFMLAYPIREVFLRIASTKGFWGYYFPFELTLAFSGFFEIMEWIIVLLVAPDAGHAYLGTQGDIWDAQKDMGLAGLGAFIAMLITVWFNWMYNKHFFKELSQSLSIKRKAPLGEVRLGEMKDNNAK